MGYLARDANQVARFADCGFAAYVDSELAFGDQGVQVVLGLERGDRRPDGRCELRDRCENLRVRRLVAIKNDLDNS